MSAAGAPAAGPGAVTSWRAALGRLAGENNEGFVAVALLVLFVAVGLAHPGFWSLVTVFGVLHNSYETLLFSLGFFLVLLTGGIDVSFDAIGIFTGYSVALMAANGVFNGNAIIAIGLAVGLGLGLGALNALAAAVLRLPVLIVTLGTRGLFWGVMLTWIGSNYVPGMPGWLGNLNNWNLVYAHSGGQGAGLNVLVVPVAVLCVLVALFLRRTMTGRGLYAVGGSAEAARRAGFPVVWIRAAAFLLAGVFAALAGLVHVGLINEANPQDLVGNELVVIAAVVVGGASIFGGKGSVTGTVLGVLLIELISSSLITLGIPSAWDNVAIGVLILLGVSFQLAGRRPARAGILAGAQ
jgi:simple sugar transport system permease protein